MKILHLCLASTYIDNYSYHENMLPKYHKEFGYDVEIVTSLVSIDENGEECFLEKASDYINEYGIMVHRINYKNNKSPICRKLRIYENAYEKISAATPDIIFSHGTQFWDNTDLVRYMKEHPTVCLYADCHTDFSNSATNWLSKNILHKIIWRHCTRRLIPYVKKFYGVLPARVDFLKNVYTVPADKVELLVMGADDDSVKRALDADMRRSIREKYNIADDDFLIVTGGKIDLFKQEVFLLADAVRKINNPHVKLIIFGSVVEELQEEFRRRTDFENIFYPGWIASEDAYCYFAAANLVVFPGRHSVLWEQAVGVGAPCVFKRWAGTTHVDLGGNCIFLEKSDEAEIEAVITDLYTDKDKLDAMRREAEAKGIEHFSYARLAAKAIEK